MYGGTQQNSWDIRAVFSRGGTLVTFIVVALAVTSCIMTLAFPSAMAGFPLAFSASNSLRAPWTIFTWPFARDASGPLGLLFAAWWFYTPSASMERAWGTRDYGLFLAATGVLTAATVWMSVLLGAAGSLGGLWIFAAPTTVAWYVANRRETVNLLLFLPVPAVVLAVIAVLLAWYYAGTAQGNSLFGFFALSGSAAAYWYATKGRYAGAGNGRYSTGKPLGGLRVTTGTGSSTTPRSGGDRERVTIATPLQNPLAWLRARLRRRKEDKQFEDILRRSGFSDPDDKPRR